MAKTYSTDDGKMIKQYERLAKELGVNLNDGTLKKKSNQKKTTKKSK